MNDKKKTATSKRHFMYFVLDADQKAHPMPPDAADTILRKILSFFSNHLSTTGRNQNGKN